MEFTSNLMHPSETTCSPASSSSNPTTPLPITRSDPNSPYPTTFVTADTSSFKQVVQMLTGSSDPSSKTLDNPSSKNYVIPPVRTAPKKQGFKLYERRNSIKNLISPLNAASHCFPLHNAASFSPRYKQEILSPSLLDFPSLTLSPVTPLVEDPFNKTSPSKFGVGGGASHGAGCGSSTAEEEEKAIAEKGYYLHPSPISRPKDSQLQLLPLFPLTSPRVSDP